MIYGGGWCFFSGGGGSGGAHVNPINFIILIDDNICLLKVGNTISICMGLHIPPYIMLLANKWLLYVHIFYLIVFI